MTHPSPGPSRHEAPLSSARNAPVVACPSHPRADRAAAGVGDDEPVPLPEMPPGQLRASSTDPGGLCPWCRRETDKDRLLVSAMDRVAPGKEQA